MKSLGLLLAAMLAFSGQTPAAAPRHLEYAFSVSPTVGDAGGSGTLSVDVLDQASGVVSVHASQLWTNGVRAQQIADCDVVCQGFAGSNPVRFMKQYADQGLKYQVVGGETAGDDALLKSFGDEAIE